MENMQQLYTSIECDILYYSKLHVVFSVWKGIYVEGERLREIFNELIKALELTGTSIIIADARNMMIIPYQDQQWTIEDWYPRAVDAGFRYQGLILSKNSFNELTVKKISNEYDDSLVKTQYFESPEDALEWVKYIRNLEVPPYHKHHLN